jgi:hypothetical protein
MRYSTILTVLAAALAWLGTLMPQFANAQEPGSVPRTFAPHSKTIVPMNASGLKLFYSKFGLYQLSISASGYNGGSHNILVRKPAADATVEKAFLMAASSSQTTINNGDIRLNRHALRWIDGHYNDAPGLPGFFHSVLADVTSIVKPVVDAFAGVGSIRFGVAEVNNDTSIDGETLVVVFNTPSDTRKRTIALLFGGQQVGGDRFEITLDRPIDPAKRGARLDMGLGISFSYQPAGQYSLINVNGQRLTTSAGGFDDGQGYNGALITAGGIGDTNANPADPNVTDINGSRYDDEKYNLLPYIKSTDRIIRVDTVNPSNDDNIFFAYFDMTASGDVNLDSDGDGLLDSWEIYGYDADGDGVIDVPLRRLGADPNKKDIFIAYAWMTPSASETKSHQPTRAVLDAITTAFANAPVSNPDGSTGITLHWKNLGGVPHVDDLNPVWDGFDAIMNPLVSEAQRHIYHRLLNGHGYGGGSSSGISRGIPASDFVETLGKWSSNPGTFMQRAGTIMHELGHNLGLRHGGVDDENYKPNHLSIMSYLNQVDWLLKDGKPYLDYARSDLGDLDESNLNEGKGLTNSAAAGGDAAIANYGVRWYNNGVLYFKKTHADSRVNWNANGSNVDNPVAVDLNNSGTQSVLAGRYLEWNNLIFTGGNIGAGAAAQKRNMMVGPEVLHELTFEEHERTHRDSREVK